MLIRFVAALYSGLTVTPGHPNSASNVAQEYTKEYCFVYNFYYIQCGITSNFRTIATPYKQTSEKVGLGQGLVLMWDLPNN